MRMIQEMGREWEGIGRGILSRPPNIPLTPHTMCVGGGGTGGNGRGLEEGYATRPPNIPLIPPTLFYLQWCGGGRGTGEG